LFEVLTGLNIKRDVVAQALSVVNEDVRQWGDEELDVFVEQVLARGKPMIVAFNKVDVPEGWERFKRVHCSLPLFPVSAELELLLKNAAQHNFIRYTPGEAGFEVVKPQLTDQQLRALEFAKQKLEVLGTTGVQQLLNSVVFDVLKMKAVYPVATKQFTDTKGNVLPDVLLLEPRATVKDLAHNIHSSIAKNLVKAVELRSGRVIGANHILQHRDVVQLLFKH
jgi:ribosome-binding ATPase YchF (GTP1/OBG family)